MLPTAKEIYAKGVHVSTFSFPKDPVLSKKWLHAIKRDDFIPTSASRVGLSLVGFFTLKIIYIYFRFVSYILIVKTLKEPLLMSWKVLEK